MAVYPYISPTFPYPMSFNPYIFATISVPAPVALHPHMSWTGTDRANTYKDRCHRPNPYYELGLGSAYAEEQDGQHADCSINDFFHGW
jgi:hypothetical protein